MNISPHKLSRPVSYMTWNASSGMAKKKMMTGASCVSLLIVKVSQSDGVYGWYVSLTALRLPLPRRLLTDTEYIDWLYYVTALADHVETDDKSWHAVAEDAEKGMDFDIDSIGSIGCHVEHGYLPMTSEQWIDELRELRRLSWEAYIEWQKDYAESNPQHIIAMHESYPAYDTIVDRLEREAAGSEVVCINKYGEDIDVWYFARTADSMFVVIVSDSM